jgi:Tfp pilus assembly protein PilF
MKASEIQSQIQRGFQLLQLGDLPAAKKVAEKLRLLSPDSADICHLLALCYSQEKSVNLALHQFNLAASLRPIDPGIAHNFSFFLRQNLRPEEIVLTLNALTAYSHAKLWLELGRAQLELDQVQQAIESLNLSIKNDRSDALAFFYLGRGFKRLFDFERALAMFNQACSMRQDAAFYSEAAAVLRSMGRLREAQIMLERALELKPAMPELLDLSAGIFVDSLKPLEALEVAQQTVKSHPGFWQGYKTLAHILWEQFGETAQAKSVMEQGILLNAREELTTPYVQFLIDLGEAESAVEFLGSINARQNPQTIASLRSKALLKLGRLSEAVAAFAEIMADFEQWNTHTHMSFVRCLLQEGDNQAAQHSIDRVLRRYPHHQEAWAYQSLIWRLQSDEREFWLCDYDNLIRFQELSFETEDFLLSLSEDLRSLHQAQLAPMAQSVRGGTQTPGNLFGRELENVGRLEAAIRRSVESWQLELQSLADQATRQMTRTADHAKHPFLSRNSRSFCFSGSWSVQLQSSGSHNNHYHSDGWMSSAFYVQLPNSVKSPRSGAPGALIFGQPPKELGLALEPRRVIAPKEGCLVLFPSYFWHGTVPFSDTSSRLTVAFDIQPLS